MILAFFFKVSHKNHLQGPKNETLFCPVFVPVYFDENTQNIENQYFGYRGPTWAWTKDPLIMSQML